MRSAARLGLFGAALAGTFAAAWGVGAAIEQIAPPDTQAAGHGHADDGPGDAASVTGLAVAADGYRLVTDSSEVAVGRTAPFTFRVVADQGEDAGSVVTSFVETHERDLHLIVVRQDLTGFQHVHPTMAADGTWSIDLAVAEPGPYRLYAEFQPADRGDTDDTTVLSTTVFGAGAVALSPVGGDSRTASVDGYELTLTGDLVPGTTSDVTVEVRRDGEAVTDLQPYLGAAGHLVALRAGDLAYVHVHPVGDHHGGRVPFAVEVPSPGTYRLFLDFRHDDAVRTAAFTVVVPTGGDAPASTAPHAHVPASDQEAHG